MIMSDEQTAPENAPEEAKAATPKPVSTPSDIGAEPAVPKKETSAASEEKIVAEPTPKTDAKTEPITEPEAAPKEESSAEPAAPKSASNGKNILIVEDERPLAHALELKLGHEGYQTTVANTGSKGLEEGLSGKYDLILLDLILPEKDGFSILEGLRAKNVETPVIVLSNLGQDEDRKKAEAFGVKKYFVKSNSPLGDIISLIRETL